MPPLLEAQSPNHWTLIMLLLLQLARTLKWRPRTLPRNGGLSHAFVWFLSQRQRASLSFFHLLIQEKASSPLSFLLITWLLLARLWVGCPFSMWALFYAVLKWTFVLLISLYLPLGPRGQEWCLVPTYLWHQAQDLALGRCLVSISSVNHWSKCQ